MLINNNHVQPWLLGRPPVTGPLVARCPLDDPLVFDPLDEVSLPFYRLVNAGNHVAFGPLSLPPWVQLDCCTTPSAMIGFARPRQHIEEDTWLALMAQVAMVFGEEAVAAVKDYDGPVPVSEYCALPSFEPGVIVGMSLYSLHPGLHLGVRTKALALACYGAREQIGVTQYANPAVRVHTTFGSLEVTGARAAAHTRADEAFVYRLAVPDADALARLVEDAAPMHPEPATESIPLDDSTQQRMQELIAEHGAARIVYPGLAQMHEQTFLQVALGRRS